MLTDELKLRLDDANESDTWRHRGEIFGQRRTYWDTGTLGRCDLEPTDHRCPIADMYAQEFRVLETVNNIRITKRFEPERPLTQEESGKVISALRKQKAGTVATVRKALGIDKKAVKDFFTLNVEKDPDREINTDWFYREIVHGVFTEEKWRALTERQRDSVNLAILKHDPNNAGHAGTFRVGAAAWWQLGEEPTNKLIEAWKARPNVDRRVNLSRRAIKNLLPYMRDCALDVTSARMKFAADPESGATHEQRGRYRLKSSSLTKAERHFLKKHPNLLPPAPMLANPVVRKAIHEVRRHLHAYIRLFGRKPDRIVVELTRSATQSEKVRNEILSRNRARDRVRKTVIEELRLNGLSANQQNQAVERVLLCRQQRGQCAYSGRQITDRMAAQGQDDQGERIEIDHIVPMSRSQDNGPNNKVLCFVRSNRNKGNQTPKEWLGEDSKDFRELEQRLRHLETGDVAEDYFTKKDYGRKWENLHRDVQDRDAFANSQLSDTGYATRQVTQWLRDVFYEGEADGVRRVFTTKGSYTAILRRDWGLFQRLRRRKGQQELTAAEQVDEKKAQAKDRGDHRHHAIDAVAIALTGPERIQDLARHAEQVEKQRARLEADGRMPAEGWPQREPLPPPWGTFGEFRHDVLSKIFESFGKADSLGHASSGAVAGHALIVSHRPVKRKLVGYFHKEDLWGDVDEERGIFRIRCSADALTPKMLRPAVPESDQQVLERIFAALKLAGIPEKEARKRAKARVKTGQFARKLADPALGLSGLVRDAELRRVIRECLEKGGLDADRFTNKQIKDFVKAGGLIMPSGMPIKSVILIGAIDDPVKIAVRDPDTGLQATNSRTGDPLFRYHFSQSNHHVEILEDENTGVWTGEVVRTIDAAIRIRKQKLPAVNRDDRNGKRFVMSLAIGEMVHMRHPTRAEQGFFVVFKIRSDGRVYFTYHWDAGLSSGSDEQEEREEVVVVPNNFRKLGVSPGSHPTKVRVDPLGCFRTAPRD